MASEELSAIVDRGWTVLPFARRVVSALTDGQFASALMEDLGRQLYPLASEFDRCGQPVPARLVLGLSEVFNELAQQNQSPSDQIVNLLNTAINQWGDLLVELDAVGQITVAEPIDTMIQLEATTARQRMVRAVATDSGRDTRESRTDSWSELRRCGDALFTTSESLLDRVQRDDISPYAAPVSRIHFLAGVLCEQLIEFTSGLRFDGVLADELTVTSGLKMPNLNECRPVSNEGGISDAAFLGEESIQFPLPRIAPEVNAVDTASSPVNRRPKVLVIDASPFFRMLFGTAIDSAGYATLALASLDEAEAQLNDSQASDIVIWGGIESSTLTDCLTEWTLRRDDSRRPMLIGLINGMEQSSGVPPEFDRVVLRTQLPELLSVIRDRLGDRTRAVKQTA